MNGKSPTNSPDSPTPKVSATSAVPHWGSTGTRTLQKERFSRPDVGRRGAHPAQDVMIMQSEARDDWLLPSWHAGNPRYDAYVAKEETKMRRGKRVSVPVIEEQYVFAPRPCEECNHVACLEQKYDLEQEPHRLFENGLVPCTEALGNMCSKKSCTSKLCKHGEQVICDHVTCQKRWYLSEGDELLELMEGLELKALENLDDMNDLDLTGTWRKGLKHRKSNMMDEAARKLKHGKRA